MRFLAVVLPEGCPLGTSMAAPIISGVFCRLKTRYPGQTTDSIIALMFETADTTEKRRHIEVYVKKRTGEEIQVESEEKLPFNVYILNTERLFREAELRWKEPPAVSVEEKKSLWDRISSFFRVF